MGRPLNKKFFGNRNESRLGGEGVATVPVDTAGSGYSQALSATLSAPQLPGGVTGTVSVQVLTSNGAISGFTVTNAGSGYTSAPTLTLVKPSNVTVTANGVSASNVLTISNTVGISVGMTVSGDDGLGGTGNTSVVTAVNTGNVVVADNHDDTISSANLTFADAGTGGAADTITLTNINENAISFVAWVPGGSSAVLGDIVRQVSSRRFLVTTAQGTGICRLVTTEPAAGEMRITATDSAGGTYYVSKISSKLVTVRSGNGTQFTDGTSVKWNFDTAVVNQTVQLENV